MLVPEHVVGAWAKTFDDEADLGAALVKLYVLSEKDFGKPVDVEGRKQLFSSENGQALAR